MAVASERLTYAFDENCAGLLKVFLAARVHPTDQLTDLPSIGIPNGTLDLELLKGVGQKGRFALIVRDCLIMRRCIRDGDRRAAGGGSWRSSRRPRPQPGFALGFG